MDAKSMVIRRSEENDNEEIRKLLWDRCCKIGVRLAKLRIYHMEILISCVLMSSVLAFMLQDLNHCMDLCPSFMVLLLFMVYIYYCIVWPRWIWRIFQKDNPNFYQYWNTAEVCTKSYSMFCIYDI